MTNFLTYLKDHLVNIVGFHVESPQTFACEHCYSFYLLFNLEIPNRDRELSEHQQRGYSNIHRPQIEHVRPVIALNEIG
jgi:hypothetical protein